MMHLARKSSSVLFPLHKARQDGIDATHAGFATVGLSVPVPVHKALGWTAQTVRMQVTIKPSTSACPQFSSGEEMGAPGGPTRRESYSSPLWLHLIPSSTHPSSSSPLLLTPCLSLSFSNW